MADDFSAYAASEGIDVPPRATSGWPAARHLGWPAARGGGLTGHPRPWLTGRARSRA